MRPLNKREYILDIATEAETVDANYSLWFRRVVWSSALKLDNELYVCMHYNQVNAFNSQRNKVCPDCTWFCILTSWKANFTAETLVSNSPCCRAAVLDVFLFIVGLFKVLPDYLKALLSIVPQDKASEQQLQQIARLAALQHRAKDSIYLPTM